MREEEKEAKRRNVGRRKEGARQSAHYRADDVPVPAPLY